MAETQEDYIEELEERIAELEAEVEKWRKQYKLREGVLMDQRDRAQAEVERLLREIRYMGTMCPQAEVHAIRVCAGKRPCTDREDDRG